MSKEVTCLSVWPWGMNRTTSSSGLFTKDIVQLQREQKHHGDSRAGGQLLMERCLGNITSSVYQKEK